MKNFWSSFASSFAKATDDKKASKDKKQFKKTIYALAPMAGVTDFAFRQICKQFGADVVYSEMASATALVYNPKKTLEMLVSSKKEAPYVIQLFGSNPEHFAKAVRILSNKNIKIKMGNGRYKIPDGIDLNFGCPVKKILKQGAGAALMDNIFLTRKIIEAVCFNTDIPVSIKIRSQAKENDALRFLDGISDLPISAIMIHGRSLAKGFIGPIDTAIIKKARDYFGGVILANGGINTPEDAKRVLLETSADGLGIARGAMGRPWIFQEVKSQKSKVKSNDEIFKIILKHTKLAEKIKGERGIIEMRAHLCAYMNGLPGAKKLRGEMVTVKSYEEIRMILKKLSDKID